MSTLALRLAGDTTSAETEARPGLITRWIERWRETRQARAEAAVRAYLADMPESRLADLGFSTDDILALHAGELRLPRTITGGH